VGSTPKQRHPEMHPAATQPLLNLKQKQHPQETPHSDSSTQPAPTTNMPDPKGRHATRPILEVRTPIAALSGEKHNVSRKS